MQKDDTVRLRHILDAAREALAFARGRSRADLDIVWRTVEEDLPAMVSILETSIPPGQS